VHVGLYIVADDAVAQSCRLRHSLTSVRLSSASMTFAQRADSMAICCCSQRAPQSVSCLYSVATGWVEFFSVCVRVCVCFLCRFAIPRCCLYDVRSLTAKCVAHECRQLSGCYFVQWDARIFSFSVHKINNYHCDMFKVKRCKQIEFSAHD